MKTNKTPLDILEQKDLVEFYLQILTERERGMVMSWCSGDSYVEIGKRVGLSKSRATQVTHDSFRRLRRFAGVKSHVPECLKLLGLDREHRDDTETAQGVRLKTHRSHEVRSRRQIKPRKPRYIPTYKSCKEPWTPHVWE